MAVTYRYDSDIVVVELDGDYSIDDLQNVLIGSLDDLRCPKTPVLLIDIRKSLSIGRRSSSEIFKIMEFMKSISNRFNNLFAVVAPNDLAYGMIRMVAVLSGESNIVFEVFRNYTEAHEWLLKKNKLTA